VAEEINELVAGPHDGGREAVHFHVAAVAQQQLSQSVAHQHALRHVVDGGGKQCASPAMQPPKKDSGTESCQKADKALGDKDKPADGLRGESIQIRKDFFNVNHRRPGGSPSSPFVPAISHQVGPSERLRRLKNRKSSDEQMFSGLPRTADIAETTGIVSIGPEAT
jgi:hypothetical protein